MRLRQTILQDALETYGAYTQTMMVFEEMAELTKELTKNMRGADNREHIAEEIADVLIMIDQMIILHNCAGLVAQFKNRKIDRLNSRLRKEHEHEAGKNTERKDT